MDFTRFDQRGQDEAGFPVDILDPVTGEPVMDNGKPCRVIIRGQASPSLQAGIRKARREARATDGDEDLNPIDDMHEAICASAIPHIAGFENVEVSGGKPATVAHAAWFVNLTYPVMGVMQDSKGNNVMVDAKDDDGNKIKVPKFELKNNPFAKQINEAAAKHSAALGKPKPA